MRATLERRVEERWMCRRRAVVEERAWLRSGLSRGARIGKLDAGNVHEVEGIGIEEDGGETRDAGGNGGTSCRGATDLSSGAEDWRLEYGQCFERRGRNASRAASSPGLSYARWVQTPKSSSAHAVRFPGGGIGPWGT